MFDFVSKIMNGIFPGKLNLDYSRILERSCVRSFRMIFLSPAKLWTFVFEIQKNISIENVRQQ